MEKYTTTQLIAADKEGIEAKKVVISNDAYALREILEQLLSASREAR